MKHLTLGIVLAIAGVLFSIGFWEFSKAYLVTGAIGLLFIAVSILMSGSLAGPHRMRAGFEAADSPDERRKTKAKKNKHRLSINWSAQYYDCVASLPFLKLRVVYL
ncbi:DUF5316 family protein [Cytobacillus sp. FSL H8-0458]|uniref:DUF5316 family protein n=1 Tax=Cytobacillus sp. FSL H8-0458 TaxID=2975346 RepID=UPI0030F7F7FD